MSVKHILQHMIWDYTVCSGKSDKYLRTAPDKKGYQENIFQGPVVQSIVNELVKGHFVNCFSRFNIQYSDIFC